jgi:hypothetical protein
LRDRGGSNLPRVPVARFHQEQDGGCRCFRSEPCFFAKLLLLLPLPLPLLLLLPAFLLLFQ